jgi:translation initiation factor 2B subunit (eIF-2B alpha/beta/delta family)
MQEVQEDRWAGWIETLEYRQQLQVVEEHVRNRGSQETNPIYYTPHDASYCLAVEKMIKALIEKSEVKLNDLEKFILFSASWTHDLGMLNTIADKFFDSQNIPNEERSLQDIRNRHAEISAWYLSSEYASVLGIPIDRNATSDARAVDNMLRNYAYTINIISKFHRMVEDITDCPKERFLKGERVRTRLLGALLRLGDTLHVDSSRFDRRLYDVLQIGQLDTAARLHWLKSYVVSNVYLDLENETIFVNVDLPEEFSKPSGNGKIGWEEAVKSLADAIISDILNDVLAVSEVFREYGLRAYAMVKPKVTFIPGYPLKDREEIAGMISDAGVVFSPNTSRVIEATIDSIVSLCRTRFDRAEHFFNQMDQLLKYLDDIHKVRPCHVGLGKVIETARNAFTNTWPKHDPQNITRKDIRRCQETIEEELNKIRKLREENKRRLYDKCKADLLENINTIILFAYSEMVTTFLDEYGIHHPIWKEKVELNVLECGGKRRLKSNNSIEYDDGLYYASQLSARGFKNIKLLPDTSFGSLAYNIQQDQKEGKSKKGNSLVLFGVNGISEDDGDCGHTSGHVMVAVVAEYFGIPVWVIADSFKKGIVDWNRGLKRETPWLTGERNLLRDIDRRNIKLVNYQEDRIPEDLIKALITEQRDVPPGPSQDHS